MDRSWLQLMEDNKKGRDFVVGDMHGCYDAFVNLLAKVDFNPLRDRVFSVGDLVDRGDKSAECLNLLRKPWFHACRGNHEQMMLDHWEDPEKPVYDPRWLEDVGEDQIQEWRRLMSKMPYVIKVGSGPKVFYVLHAELWEPHNLLTEAMIDTCSLTGKGEFHAKAKCLWGRHVISSHWRGSKHKFQAPEIGRIFSGHTIVQLPILAENTVYIDTGAFAPYIDPAAAAEHFGLSMVEPATLRHWFAPTISYFRGTVVDMGRVCAELAPPVLFVDMVEDEDDDEAELSEKLAQSLAG